jgi:hypothetical protein
VVKEVSPQQVQMIRMSALHYVENWQKHQAQAVKIG